MSERSASTCVLALPPEQQKLDYRDKDERRGRKKSIQQEIDNFEIQSCTLTYFVRDTQRLMRRQKWQEVYDRMSEMENTKILTTVGTTLADKATINIICWLKKKIIFSSSRMEAVLWWKSWKRVKAIFCERSCPLAVDWIVLVLIQRSHWHGVVELEGTVHCSKCQRRLFWMRWHRRRCLQEVCHERCEWGVLNIIDDLSLRKIERVFQKVTRRLKQIIISILFWDRVMIAMNRRKIHYTLSTALIISDNFLQAYRMFSTWIHPLTYRG